LIIAIPLADVPEDFKSQLRAWQIHQCGCNWRFLILRSSFMLDVLCRLNSREFSSKYPNATIPERGVLMEWQQQHLRRKETAPSVDDTAGAPSSLQPTDRSVWYIAQEYDKNSAVSTISQRFLEIKDVITQEQGVENVRSSSSQNFMSFGSGKE
jgi:hypothetical protein